MNVTTRTTFCVSQEILRIAFVSVLLLSKQLAYQSTSGVIGEHMVLHSSRKEKLYQVDTKRPQIPLVEPSGARVERMANYLKVWVVMRRGTFHRLDTSPSTLGSIRRPC